MALGCTLLDFALWRPHLDGSGCGSLAVASLVCATSVTRTNVFLLCVEAATIRFLQESWL